MENEKFGLQQRDIDTIISLLQSFEEIEEAVIFGSRAKGNYKKGSDIDIALVGNIDFKTLTHISYLLNQESLMPYKFDLVVYSAIKNQALKEHIDRVGIRFYARTEKKV